MPDTEALREALAKPWDRDKAREVLRDKLARAQGYLAYDICEIIDSCSIAAQHDYHGVVSCILDAMIDFAAETNIEELAALNTSQAESAVPAGMKSWSGGASPPSDWLRHEVVGLRGGCACTVANCPDSRWQHHGDSLDIIAYTPKAQPAVDQVREGQRYYIDCEFDGHGGSLLSIAVVSDGGLSAHFRTTEPARDPWVIANVVPLMESHDADVHAVMPLASIGDALRYFIGTDQAPTIVADSPVDIGRFCAALSTGPDGGWASTNYPLMRFEVHNVDCYPTDLPGAVQHNAWWDAMALRAALQSTGGGNGR